LQTSLAIAGSGILFGAVIGIKKKTDNNSKEIHSATYWNQP